MTSGIGETPAQRLGRLIRARRKKLKLTQADVQERDGPSTATLRLIEGGKHTDFRDGTGAALEAALQWAPGSIDAVLSGGEPTSISDEPQLSTTMLAGQLFHPSRRPVTKDMVANDPAVARVLEDLLSRGKVDEADRPLVERALEDARIAALPMIYEALSRAGKLQVANLGTEVHLKELRQQFKEEMVYARVEDAQKPPASPEVHQNEEALVVADQVDDGTSIDADVGTKADDPGVNRAKDGKKGHDLPGA